MKKYLFPICVIAGLALFYVFKHYFKMDSTNANNLLKSIVLVALTITMWSIFLDDLFVNRVVSRIIFVTILLSITGILVKMYTTGLIPFIQTGITTYDYAVLLLLVAVQLGLTYGIACQRRFAKPQVRMLTEKGQSKS